MDYNKIIIALVIVLVAIAISGFVFLNRSNNAVPDNKNINNTTSSSVNVDKISEDEKVSSNEDNSKYSSSDSKYVTREYAQQHSAEWQSGKGYYWVGDTQYDSATGKIIGGGSAKDQQALREVYGDMT
jgi:uncharacterized protein YxeA